MDIPRHIAKGWPVRSGGGRLLVNHLNSSNFKFLKNVGDREDKGRVGKK